MYSVDIYNHVLKFYVISHLPVFQVFSLVRGNGFSQSSCLPSAIGKFLHYDTECVFFRIGKI